MKPKVRLGNIFASSLQGIIPSASRDCSTCKFQSQMTFRLCTLLYSHLASHVG